MCSGSPLGWSRGERARSQLVGPLGDLGRPASAASVSLVSPFWVLILGARLACVLACSYVSYICVMCMCFTTAKPAQPRWQME